MATGALHTLERRAASLEVRAAHGRKLTGYAATFGSEARIGATRETIAAGAFRATLASGRDVLALVDHDPARVLARTKSGTLRLSEDVRGLAFEIDLPDTTAGRDVLALAERGDLGGMSFGFRVVDEIRDADRRELRAVELVEVSVIGAFPAYQGTSVEARKACSWTARRRAAAAQLLLTMGAL
jgi:hypothetical protein